MRPLRTRSLRARPVRLLAGAVLVLGVAACSDDDGGDVATDDTESTDDTRSTEGTEATQATEMTGDTTVDETSAGTGAGGGDACETLRPLSEYDQETARLVQGGDWTALQTFIVDTEDEVVDAYESSADLIPELSDDLVVLRDLAVDYSAAAADAPDFATWASEVTELATDEHPDAGPAALALNTWAEENCGFSTGGN